MIFTIESNFINPGHSGTQPSMLSDICIEIMLNGHYISCDAKTHESICHIINKHGSTSQKNLLHTYKGFDTTAEQKKYYTTIHVSNFSLEELKRIISQPAMLLIEHGPNEWEVYKVIIGAYKHDRKYRNLFLALEEAKNKQQIIYLHGGGCTTFPVLICSYNTNQYKNILKYKLCSVFDRDTGSSNVFDPHKNGLFSLFCGKNNSTITDSDIYTLSQPDYIWHMWYKRAIENYFPNSQYTKAKFDISAFPAEQEQRDYLLIDSSSAVRYGKGKLPQLADGMNKNAFEQNLKMFQTGGESLSELQLFLLKLIKII